MTEPSDGRSELVQLGSYVALSAQSMSDALAALGLSCDSLSPLDTGPEDWSLEPEARQILLAIVKASQPRAYLEVGAHRGATCLAVAELLKTFGHGKAYAIEPREDFAAEIQSRVSTSVLPITVLALSSAQAFNNWGREALDMILIDGDHSLASVVFDIASWSSLLSDDGWMLIHDTVSRLERRFPDDYISAPGLFDIVDIVQLRDRPSGHFWEGLAVLRWSDAGRAIRDQRHLYRSGQ